MYKISESFLAKIRATLSSIIKNNDLNKNDLDNINEIIKMLDDNFLSI